MLGKNLIQAAAGAGAAGEATYVEDVFSTYLYTGNGSTQTITNGIDLVGEGGLVWIKSRSGSFDHILNDTVRGLGSFSKGLELQTNSTSAQSDVDAVSSPSITSFNVQGFTLGAGSRVNLASSNFVSWTFRKAEKFFDVVTWTGDSVAGRTIPHNLGSVPGCIIVKNISTVSNWAVYHRSVGATAYLELNTTTNALTSSSRWNDTEPTTTVFTVGNDTRVNETGSTYVAYLFAHDAGGFGDDGTESVIKCGSYTGNGSTSGPTIDLGWEPQWLLIKRSDTSGSYWCLVDAVRGFTVSGGNDAFLYPNASDAESAANWVAPLSTGFQLTTTDSPINANGGTYIYIAIRRGPMKTPEDATTVLSLDVGTNPTSGGVVTTGFPVDMSMTSYRTLGGVAATNDRLRGYGLTNTVGATPVLYTSSTNAESSYSGSSPHFYNAWNTTIVRGGNGADPGGGIVSWFFRRAPGFFDVVAYTGTGSARTVSHNLGVAPELIIVKSRSTATHWYVYSQAVGNTKALLLSDYSGATSASAVYWNNTDPTSSEFTVGTNFSVNQHLSNYIAYLFASCPGVSKVGSYTGTGNSSFNVNCGFASGTRFVLIKRTDSSGDWYVWDSARGLTLFAAPYLRLNSTAAEVTGANYINSISSGFAVSAGSPELPTNITGATYIYLAIA